MKMDESKLYLNKSSRDAYGIAFYKQAESDQRIVALTADVPDSVRFTRFREMWPERFFNFGIAEQNMMGAAAGFAREGKIPFVSVYAIFAALRALEQVRTDIAYPNLPVRICTTHSGISLGQAGPSHHSIEDIGVMRSIFNMVVLAPADGIATAMALESIKDHPGPVYMRLSRAVEPTVYHSKSKYQIGKANILREGKDITIIAYGASVGNAMKAAEKLAEEGIDAGIVDMAFVKPIDRDAVEKAAKTTGQILTVEEHNIVNGLGSAVAEVIAESNLNVSFKRLALPDHHTLAGPYPDLQKYYSLDSEGIAKTVRNLL
ncbi:MAG: transketolase family protein [Anaerolineales bacterium]|nr:transketolase family protein [Anaerolineales bacterium]